MDFDYIACRCPWRGEDVDQNGNPYSYCLSMVSDAARRPTTILCEKDACAVWYFVNAANPFKTKYNDVEEFYKD